MVAALLGSWHPIETGGAVLLFAAFVCTVVAAIVALGILGRPFHGLSDALHPLLAGCVAERAGTARPSPRSGAARSRPHGEPRGRLRDPRRRVVVLFGLAVLAIGVAALVALGPLGVGAERLGL